ncbi:MAG: cell wall metabolism sensor histidine kinase WalK, partial [Burkholderiaceae bacterium]|nr:cell wall metabolism sensor histidine kinase WalK [Burkholderiaceae bacterium]
MRNAAALTWIAAGCAAALALLAAAVAVVAVALSEEERATLAAVLASERAPLLAYGVAVLLVIAGAAAHGLFRRYPLAARRLAEEARVLLAANPDHRVQAAGGPALQELAGVINQLAARYRQTERELDARSAEARARVEEERDRFAALMSELSEGVLVCNTDGRVLLYNARAAALLADASEGNRGAYAPLGLGRSIFGLLDRDQVAHALDKIHQQFARGSDRPHTRFIAAGPGGRALRVQVAPFLAGGERQVAGMVFTLDDLSGLL